MFLFPCGWADVGRDVRDAGKSRERRWVMRLLTRSRRHDVRVAPGWGLAAALACAVALLLQVPPVAFAEEGVGTTVRAAADPVMDDIVSSLREAHEGSEGVAIRPRDEDTGRLVVAAEEGNEAPEVEQEAPAAAEPVPAEVTIDEQLIEVIKDKLGLPAAPATAPQLAGVQRWIPDFRIEVNMIGNKTYYDDEDTAKAILRGEDEDEDGDDEEEPLPVDKFKMHEVEFGFQTAIDPYARADVFLSAEEEGAELEEGYLTLIKLPYSMQARIGKFRAPYGEINDIDPEEMPFIDYPPALLNIFGPEGAVETGAWFNVATPGPWETYLLWWGGITDGANEVSFHGGDANKVNLFARFEVFQQVAQYAGWELGTTFITGYNDPDGQYRTHIENVHFELDWKDPYLSLYKSFAFQAEVFFVQREMAGMGLDLDEDEFDEPEELEEAEAALALMDLDLSRGAFHLEDDDLIILPGPGAGKHMETSFSTYALARYQLGRRWFVSGRADYSELPINSDWREIAFSGTLLFNPSRFLNFRAQYKHTDRNFGIGDTDELYIQVLFKIGFERPELF